MAWASAGLDAEAYDRSYSDAELLRRIERYFVQQRALFLRIGLALLLIVVGDLAQPLIISAGVNVIADNHSLLALAVIAGSVYMATVGSWVANLIRRRATSLGIGN